MVFWEASKRDERWNESNHLELGVLKSKSGRATWIPRKYTRDVMTEVHNSRGEGIMTARQLLVGLRVGNKKGLLARMSRKERAKKRKSTAKSQTAVAAHAHPANATQMENAEQYNYFVDCRIFSDDRVRVVHEKSWHVNDRSSV